MNLFDLRWLFYGYLKAINYVLLILDFSESFLLLKFIDSFLQNLPSVAHQCGADKLIKIEREREII